MILWVLVVISAAILGVFFYVITIQKEKQFGVLKAIGMEMKELTNFIVSQVIMLALIGFFLEMH
jgi:putative ABC transport system permease protein